MQKIKANAIASTVAQITPGTDFDCIIHEGVIYVPMFQSDELKGLLGGKAAPATDAPAAPSKKETPAPAKKETPAAAAPAKKGAGKKVEEAEEASDEDDEKVAAVRDLLTRLDKGEISPKRAKSQLVTDHELDEDTVAEVLTKIDDDQDYSIDDAIAELFGGEEKAPPAKGKGKAEAAPVSKKAAPKAAAGVDPKNRKKDPGGSAVDIADVEKGNVVYAFWEEGLKTDGWYEGTVVKIGKGGVVSIDYGEDGTTDYDPEVVTELRLA